MYSYGPPHMAKQKQDDQLKHTYSSSVRIRDVALKTCQKRWMIGRSGEWGSGISVLAAWHDDDDFHNKRRKKVYFGWVSLLNGQSIFILTSECHILPARAGTPAFMLHLSNPCAERKVLSLTKPKGKIYKTKSLGHYITLWRLCSLLL